MVFAPAWGVDQYMTLPLLYNDQPLTLVGVHEAGPGSKEVESAEVLYHLETLLTEEAFANLKKALEKKPRWPLGEAVAGVTLAYDPLMVAVVIKLEPTLRGAQPLPMVNRQWAQTSRIVEPQEVSAYANFSVAGGYQDGYGQGGQRQPTAVSVDGAFNVKGYVAESQINYSERAPHTLSLSNSRLVHDDVERMLRYQAGELTYPTATFQRYRQMVGVGLARNFSLRPYNVTQPVGRTQFQLSTAATVEVFVNGNHVKSLQLGPGVYEVKDFPLVSGANEVRLMIRDATGKTEERRFSIISDGNLLDEGLSEFSANIGVPKTGGAVVSGTAQQMSFTGLYRHGFTPQLTLGANLQADAEKQLAGVEQAWGSKLGFIKMEAALSHARFAEDPLDLGGRIEYRSVMDNHDGVIEKNSGQWQASLQYQGRNFDLENVYSLPNRYAWDGNLSYNRRLSASLSLTVGGNYRVARADGLEDDCSLLTGVYYRIGPALALHVNGSYSKQQRYAALANLTWSPLNSRQMVEASYDTETRTAKTEWTRQREQARTGWDTGVEVARSDQANQLGGSAGYMGERGTFRVQHNRRTAVNQGGNSLGEGSTTQLSAASALVYSGGRFAVTRPVMNSFAIVEPANKTSGTQVTLNAAGNAGSLMNDAQSSFWGPAVLSDLMPYNYRTVQADVTGEMQQERDSFTLFPTYKSGLRVLAGMPSSVVVHGYLRDANGQPLALHGGTLHAHEELAEIEPAAGPKRRKPELVFTNREGYFRIDGLEAGKYTIRVHNNADQALTFEVPENVQGEIYLGDMKVNMIPGRVLAATAPAAGAP